MVANRTKDSLKGSVNELYTRTVTLSAGGQDVADEFQSLRLSRYDQRGNKIEDAHYNSDDSLLFKTIYAYDSANKLIEQVNFAADESPSLKTVFEYDRDGRLIEQKTLGSDGSFETKLRPAYTAEGLRIEEETLPLFEEHGDVGFCIDIEGTAGGFSASGGDRIRKVYDSEGKPIEITVRNNKGTRTGKMFFAYDGNNRLIETANYGSNEIYPCGERTRWQRIFEPFTFRLIKIFLCIKCIYNFGARGELRKAGRCIIYGPLLMSTVFVYDKEGKIVEEQNNFLGSLQMKKVFTYDEEGNKAEEIEYIRDNTVLQKQNYSRKYDSHGNWIEETISHQFRMNEKIEQSTTATYRTIGYYSN